MLCLYILFVSWCNYHEILMKIWCVCCIYFSHGTHRIKLDTIQTEAIRDVESVLWVVIILSLYPVLAIHVKLNMPSTLTDSLVLVSQQWPFSCIVCRPVLTVGRMCTMNRSISSLTDTAPSFQPLCRASHSLSYHVMKVRHALYDCNSSQLSFLQCHFRIIYILL